MTWPHEPSPWARPPATGDQADPGAAPTYSASAVPPGGVTRPPGAVPRPPDAAVWAPPAGWSSTAPTTAQLPATTWPAGPGYAQAGYAPTPPSYQPPPGYPPAYQPPPGGAGWPPPAWPGQPGWGTMPPEPPRRSRGPIFAVVVMALFALILGVGGAYLLGQGTDTNNALTPNGRTNTDSAPNAAPTAPSAAPFDEAALAAKVNPVIVDINTTLGLQNARAAGTGVILSAEGLILTNNHVIAGATKISVVSVGNGNTYDATVLGYSQAEDIAVVQLANASGLTAATIGNSDSVKVGQPIMALGNAGGVGGTPDTATGTVTALNRSITATDEMGGSEHLTDLIEVAADIQPGDSGGPLVNTDGQVIGIDTAASASFRYQASGGRGYAIPINKAMDLAHAIINKQASATIHIGPTAFLGVLTKVVQGTSGAGVVSVVPDSPAAGTGLSAGDVITSLNGSTVDSPTAIGQLMVPHHPGDRATIGWVDQNGRSHQATVTLAEGPPA